MKEIEDSNLDKGAEKNISDNAFSHLKNSVSHLAIQAENQSLVPNGSDKTPPADALKPLTTTERAKKHQSSKMQEGKIRRPLCPLPKNAPDFTKDTPAYHNKQFNSKPLAIYPYEMADSSLAFYMVRWHPQNEDGTPTLDEAGKPSKIVLPYCYVEDEKMNRYWFSCGFPEPRPLYNLPEILARPQAPVLVVEGEENVDTLKPLLLDYVLTTSAHGSQSPHKSDWSAFKDRKVIICPDADKAGIHYGDAVCMKSKEAGALSVQLLALDLLVKSLLKKESIPEGYDLADAVKKDGLNPVLLNQSLESFLSPYLTSNEIISLKFPDKTFKIDEKGSVKYWYEAKKKEEKSEWRWLCGYLVVTHRTRDKDNGGWAKIATLIDGDGIRKEIKIAGSLLSGDGNALGELLLNAGLALNLEAKKKLIQYLNRSNPSARKRTVDKVGWYKEAYVLPRKTYGNANGEDVVLEMDGELPTYNVRGTLAEWQENIGQHLEGNSRLLGAVGTCLVSPVLTPLGREGFGVHTRGASSIGKSKTSHVASSVYGSKVRSWSATCNGAEAWGVESNDNILILDETGRVPADVLADSIYMLFNGQGKGRMKRSGGARPTSEFKLCVWSNGEIGAESKIQESKRNKTYNAGQAVRLMEIPADAGKGFGIFETLHTFKDGAEFSSHLEKMSKIYCGTLGDAWLTLLTEHKEEILKRVEEYEIEFIEETPLEDKADKQVGRARGHFALMAGCLEVAIEKGLLPLKKGSGIKACQDLLNAWIVQRGGLESHEVMDFKKRVINFLLEHGNSRFQRIGDDVRTNNMMGYWDEQNGKVTYYAYPSIFEKELIKGGDPKLLLTALVDAGILERDKDQFAKGKRLPTTQENVGDNKKNQRVYWLTLPDDS